MADQVDGIKQRDISERRMNQSAPSRHFGFLSIIFIILIYSSLFVYIYHHVYIKTTNSFELQRQDYSKNAFVSIYSSDKDLLSTLILGYTIRKFHPKHPMILLDVNNKTENVEVRCVLETMGWTLIRAAPLRTALPVQILLWNMVEFDSMVYLHPTSIVYNDLSHLHDLVSQPNRTGFELASTSLRWLNDSISHDLLVLHPSRLIFNEFQRNSIQSSLDQISRRYIQLPVIYRLTPLICSSDRSNWKIIQLDDRDNSSRCPMIEEVYQQVYRDFYHLTDVQNLPRTCQMSIEDGKIVFNK